MLDPFGRNSASSQNVPVIGASLPLYSNTVINERRSHARALDKKKGGKQHKRKHVLRDSRKRNCSREESVKNRIFKTIKPTSISKLLRGWLPLSSALTSGRCSLTATMSVCCMIWSRTPCWNGFHSRMVPGQGREDRSPACRVRCAPFRGPIWEVRFGTP